MNAKDLLPGDCLLYRPGCPIGLWIAIKTWAWVSHVEVYAGNGVSYAARVSGVDAYKFRAEHLAYVLRPIGRFDADRADRWFDVVAKGQKYDFLGLLCFYLARKQGAQDRMFCSELATRYYRAGGHNPFNPLVDADTISPAQFRQSPAFRVVWRKQ